MESQSGKKPLSSEKENEVVRIKAAKKRVVVVALPPPLVVLEGWERSISIAKRE